MSDASANYTFYGQACDAGEVRDFLEHILKQTRPGALPTPVCVWGTHGIGKTELVHEVAAANGYDFVYVAPAQFEEMGDLLGMPAIEDGKTVLRPPEWVPTEPGPGILLLDDVNRADDRILRGLMQLLQRHALASWALPQNWHIVLTANPDGGDYSVTPMDDAMLTRMLHVTLQFDARAWAAWAERAGVDARGIDFVLLYPELVRGQRTTPRSLTQFFRHIADIDDLRSQLALVQTLGAACLDDETVAAFVAFVQQNLAAIIQPEEILAAKNFERDVQRRIESSTKGDVLRVDILATLCTRLWHHLLYRDAPPTEREIDNLRRFVLLDVLPNDLRLSLLQELAGHPGFGAVTADAAVATALLDGM